MSERIDVHDGEYSAGRGLLTLWAGLLVPPIAWAISFETNYAMTPWTCAGRRPAVLLIAFAVAAAVSAGAGLLAWRSYRELEHETVTAADRARFMALGGALGSLLFTIVILAMALPPLLLSTCD